MFRKRPHLVLFGMVAAIVIPTAISLNTVNSPEELGFSSDNPTPLGYTYSLLIFIFPLTLLILFFLRRPDYLPQRCAFWKTVAILTPLGFALDFFFGNVFFEFGNHGAVSGIRVPALGGGIPIEEFLFYFTGNMLVLLLYIWNDEYWVAAYSVSEYKDEAKKTPKIVQFHLESVIFGIALWVAAVVYKKFFSHVSDGMPWYFTYLVMVSFIPSAGFFPAVRRLVNWRAFSVTFLTILLISLVWEATLGVPYNWWNYNHSMMIGIFIEAWHELPIEAVLVWLAVTYTAVILYEFFKLYQASRKPILHALFGTQPLWISLLRDARTLGARAFAPTLPAAEASGVVAAGGLFDVENMPLPRRRERSGDDPRSRHPKGL